MVGVSADTECIHANDFGPRLHVGAPRGYLHTCVGERHSIRTLEGRATIDSGGLGVYLGRSATAGCGLRGTRSGTDQLRLGRGAVGRLDARGRGRRPLPHSLRLGHRCFPAPYGGAPRRSGRQATHERLSAELANQVNQARRNFIAEELAVLHDTAAATLLLVGQGPADLGKACHASSAGSAAPTSDASRR